MAKLYFPTWVTALDGNRKIVQNPSEYFRETGIEVDEQLQPLKKSEHKPDQPQSQQAKPTGEQHLQHPDLSPDKATQGANTGVESPAEPPSSLPEAEATGIEGAGAETRSLTALPTVDDLVKAGTSKTRAAKIVAEEQRKFAAGEAPYRPLTETAPPEKPPTDGQ